MPRQGEERHYIGYHNEAKRGFRLGPLPSGKDFSFYTRKNYRPETLVVSCLGSNVTVGPPW